MLLVPIGGVLLLFAVFSIARRHVRIAMRRTALTVLAAMTLAAACRAKTPPPKDVVLWKEVGTGRAVATSRPAIFTSDSGGFRVHWTLTNETRKDAGRLRVVLRSMDSGREIVEAIDARGAGGGGTEEVAAERPRWDH